MIDTVAAVAVFAVVVALLAVLRARTGNKLDIKSSDIALALVPIALWMLLTGKVQEFAFGDVKIVTAIREASKSPVDKQVTPLPVVSVRTDAKAGVMEIPNLLRKKTEALSFTLGYGGYYGPAISEYLAQLSRSPAFRYVVINRRDGTLFGMVDGSQLAAVMAAPGSRVADDFARSLNSDNADAIGQLPGFIPSDKALKKSANKRKALESMESLDVQTLPVVDDSGRLVGVVDRSKLTASILLEISEKVGS